MASQAHIDSLHQRPVAVLGAQRSGIAAATLLHRSGARVLLSDSADDAVSDEMQQSLRNMGIEVELGQHSQRVYDASLIVISPGIPETAPVIREIERRNIPMISEVELASWFVRAPLIAVTGSNGKTTTSTLIAKFLDNRFYAPRLCGNIGNSFAGMVQSNHREGRHPVYVVEVSSFQLERIPTFRPDVGIILNITPDHMNRYQGFDEYVTAKLNITANQTGRDILVYNMDDPVLENIETEARLIGFSLHPDRAAGPFHWDGSHILWDDERLIAYQDCGLKGMHNLANVLAGLNAIHAYIPSGEHPEFREHLRQVLRHFSGIEHRMEFVAAVDAVSFYNDSKATNIESVKYAIESFDHPVFLILGGYDKGGDFTQLIPGIRKHVKKTLVIGKDRRKIQSMLEPSVSVALFGGLPEAVRFAADEAEPGDVVLLSPACASFDQYTNYEERGAHFKQLVEQLRQ